MIVALDVGGTFTDAVIVPAEGAPRFLKVPSTPWAPEQAVLDILNEIADPNDPVDTVALGTTVATNALLQRRGARVGLVTTEGFRDVLEIGRQARPHVFDLRVRRSQPLVPREHRLEVRERISAQGEVLVELDPLSLEKAAAYLRQADVEIAVVAFLNSYRNPSHELQAAEYLRRQLNVPVIASTEVVREFREFERFSTAVVNAYLIPLMKRYLEALVSRLAERTPRPELLVVNSSGGLMIPRQAWSHPIATFLSGPSAGVAGSQWLGRLMDRENLITMDIGGTSTDVSVIYQGRIPRRTQAEIDGMVLREPQTDIHTVGAGGGSIAYLDATGLLRVGPESAGADPGPACYGRGQPRPTVTDALAVLGYFSDSGLLAGKLRLHRQAAAEACAAFIANPRGISVEQAAWAIVRIETFSVAQAIREITVERGYDPTQFSLLAYGGMGPMLAVFVAEEIGMQEVLVPETPGLLSAMGILTSPLRVEVSRTVWTAETDALFFDVVRQTLSALESEARMALGQVGIGETVLEGYADLRYQGQNHEIEVTWSVRGDQFSTNQWQALKARFFQEHQRLYGFNFEDRPLELVTLRVALVEAPRQRITPSTESSVSMVDPTPAGYRPVVWAEDARPLPTPYFHRGSLGIGQTLIGPAIVDQMDSTTVIPAGWQVYVDPFRTLCVRKSSKGKASQLTAAAASRATMRTTPRS